jgi:hypothetical protein
MNLNVATLATFLNLNLRQAMKTAIIIALSAYGLSIDAGHAATFTCTFFKDRAVVAKCLIDTANPKQTCETQYSNTLQGSCLGNGSLITCAFHDPKIKAVDAIQMVRNEKEGAKLATPAGFISGGSTVANAIQAFAIGYVERSGAPQFNAGCSP